MYLSKCELCPRRCGVNRSAGETGFCKAGADVEIFRYGPHHGEEPPISGERGSGTVFFSRCTLRCVYCQNHPWSQEGQGEKYGAENLAGVFVELKRRGCHNWNLVSPTPWLPQIRDALRTARADEDPLPIVYNTSGFERPEILETFNDVTDVFLTDLRYAWHESALEGSGNGAYAESARAALREMWRLKGPLKTDERGIAISGTICRILVLPGRADEAVGNLRWLAETVGTDVSLSLMAQYLPLYKAVSMESWNRQITEDEYTAVCDEAEKLGFSNGWIQEYGVPAEKNLVGKDMQGGPGEY